MFRGVSDTTEKITVKPPPTLADNPVMPKDKALGIRKHHKEGVEKIVVPPPTTLAEDPLLPREEVLGLKINKKLKKQEMQEKNEPIVDLLEEERDATTPGYVTEATKLKIQKMKEQSEKVQNPLSQ